MKPAMAGYPRSSPRFCWKEKRVEWEKRTRVKSQFPGSLGVNDCTSLSLSLHGSDGEASPPSQGTVEMCLLK